MYLSGEFGKMSPPLLEYRHASCLTHQILEQDIETQCKDRSPDIQLLLNYIKRRIVLLQSSLTGSRWKVLTGVHT